jgi:hypothetical protein
MYVWPWRHPQTWAIRGPATLLPQRSCIRVQPRGWLCVQPPSQLHDARAPTPNTHLITSPPTPLLPVPAGCRGRRTHQLHHVGDLGDVVGGADAQLHCTPGRGAGGEGVVQWGVARDSSPPPPPPRRHGCGALTRRQVDGIAAGHRGAALRHSAATRGWGLGGGDWGVHAGRCTGEGGGGGEHAAPTCGGAQRREVRSIPRPAGAVARRAGRCGRCHHWSVQFMRESRRVRCCTQPAVCTQPRRAGAVVRAGVCGVECSRAVRWCTRCPSGVCRSHVGCVNAGTAAPVCGGAKHCVYIRCKWVDCR